MPPPLSQQKQSPYRNQVGVSGAVLDTSCALTKAHASSVRMCMMSCILSGCECRGWTSRVPEEAPAEIAALVQRCTGQPEERPSAAECAEIIGRHVSAGSLGRAKSSDGSSGGASCRNLVAPGGPGGAAAAAGRPPSAESPRPPPPPPRAMPGEVQAPVQE